MRRHHILAAGLVFATALTSPLCCGGGLANAQPRGADVENNSARPTNEYLPNAPAKTDAYGPGYGMDCAAGSGCYGPGYGEAPPMGPRPKAPGIAAFPPQMRDGVPGQVNQRKTAAPETSAEANQSGNLEPGAGAGGLETAAAAAMPPAPPLYPVGTTPYYYDTGGEWGWFGLLGLIGLAGLWRSPQRNADRTDHP